MIKFTKIFLFATLLVLSVGLFSNKVQASSGSGNVTVTVTPPPVNGACSSSHYICTSGTSVSNVDGATTWTWGCNGSNGGTSTSATACSEAKPVNGACSSSHYSCSTGTSVNNVSGASAWTWSCNGSNGGSNDTSCSEAKPVNGACSSSHYICTSGTSVSNVDGATTWTWGCNGSNGGTSTSATACSETKPLPPVNGACSSSHYICTSGTSVSNVDGATTWTWGCNGSNGGTSTSATACSQVKPITDSCGSGSGVTPQASEPTGALACDSGSKIGSPSDTTKVWNWSCGTTATSCSAPKYGCTTTTDTNYNSTGPSNNWGCSNTCANGASASTYPTCTIVADACGSASGTTPQLTQPTGASACSSGTLNSSSPADTTLAWKWSCGSVTSCSAPKYGCNVSTDTNYNSTGPNNNWSCSNTCANGKTNYPTCTISSDACGSGSGTTPQLTQPSGSGACTSGALNGSSPADTTTAWNWSCGALTCSAPKYGCTTTTDTNYNPSGPNNDWNCSLTCANGKTNYPTCTTVAPSCGNGAVNYPTCTVNGGGSCINGGDNPNTCTTTGGGTVCINGAANPPTCDSFTPTAGSWSDWSPSLSVCPGTSITQTRTYTPPTNGGDNSRAGEPSSRTVNPTDCPTLDVSVTRDGLPVTDKIPYNGKAKVIWTSTKTSDCSCTYYDLKTGANPGSCGNGIEYTYQTPALKKDTRYTIVCNGGYGISVSGVKNVLVAPINTNVIEQ